MKMYKIIPAEHKVEELTYNGDYNQMKNRLPYACFDHAKMTLAGDRVFVNDMGLLDGTEEREGGFFWTHDHGQEQHFVGQALFWGTFGENNADPSLSLQEVRDRISWTPKKVTPEKDKEIIVKGFDNVEDLLNSMGW